MLSTGTRIDGNALAFQAIAGGKFYVLGSDGNLPFFRLRMPVDVSVMAFHVLPGGLGDASPTSFETPIRGRVTKCESLTKRRTDE
jgi:hypothetical protein